MHQYCMPPVKMKPLNNPLLGPIIDGWQLRVCIIVGKFRFNGGGMSIIELGRVEVPGFPQSKMHLYLLDKRIILNKGNNLHRPLTLGAQQWINLINSLDQARPVSTKSSR